MEMILKIDDVVKKCHMSKATIYKKAKEGTFPKPFKLSERSSGWLESEINEWIQHRIAEREKNREVV